METRVHDVLVIGAGAAGMSAARRLSQVGIGVALLEARDRTGGRIWTLPAPGGPPLELGAEFVHGEPPEVLELARAAGIELHEADGEAWQHHGGLLRRLDGEGPGLDIVLGRMASGPGRDASFTRFLETRCADLPPAARELVLAYVEGFHAAPAARASVRALAEEHAHSEAIHGDRTFRLAGGYGALGDWLEAGLRSARVSLELDARVAVLRWKGPDVEAEVLSSRGERRTIRARKAIVTLPVSLLSRSPDAAGAVRFLPDLPGKWAAAAGLETGSVVKLLLRFREAFWETWKLPASPGGAPLPRLGFIVSRDPQFPTWWTQLPARAPVLAAWAGGPAAEMLASIGPDEQIARALGSLSRLLGLERATVEAQLESARSHDWQADPFSRGAYSYEAVGGAGARRILAEPAGGVLFFAGEATRFDGETGTVAAALATGTRAANEVLRSLGRS